MNTYNYEKMKHERRLLNSRKKCFRDILLQISSQDHSATLLSSIFIDQTSHIMIVLIQEIEIVCTLGQNAVLDD